MVEAPFGLPEPLSCAVVRRHRGRGRRRHRRLVERRERHRQAERRARASSTRSRRSSRSCSASGRWPAASTTRRWCRRPASRCRRSGRGCRSVSSQVTGLVGAEAEPADGGVAVRIGRAVELRREVADARAPRWWSRWARSSVVKRAHRAERRAGRVRGDRAEVIGRALREAGDRLRERLRSCCWSRGPSRPSPPGRACRRCRCRCRGWWCCSGTSRSSAPPFGLADALSVAPVDEIGFAEPVDTVGIAGGVVNVSTEPYDVPYALLRDARRTSRSCPASA